MTTPHFILEELDRWDKLRQLAIIRDGKDIYPAMDVIKDIYKRAVHFHFGNITPQEEHKDFGEDLFLNDMFILPFKHTFVTYDKFAAGKGQSILFYMDEGKLYGLVSGNTTVDNVGTFNIPKMSYSCQKAVGVNPEEARFYFEYGPVSPWFPVASKELLHDVAGQVFGLCFCLLTMLMGEEVEQRIEPPPAKLNKMRAAKGKPIINERRTIVVKPHARRVLLSDDQHEPSGRTQAMHFRRGHFRRLAVPRKRDGVQVIPIPPTLINADYANMAIPKDYKIK